jgi:hypothetical protein
MYSAVGFNDDQAIGDDKANSQRVIASNMALRYTAYVIAGS